METEEITRKQDVSRDRIGIWHKDRLLVTDHVSEDMLAVAYLRFKAEGLLKYIFNEGTIGLSAFMQKYGVASGVRCLACLTRDENGQLNASGMGFITQKQPVGYPPVYTKAEVSQCFYRKVNPKDTLLFGKLMIRYAFDDLDLGCLFGCTPEKNLAAVRYVKAQGFEVHGPLAKYTAWPNPAGQLEPCGAYISVLTREKWEVENEQQ